MPLQRSSFRLHILGKRPELTILAEFNGSRIAEHITIDRNETDWLINSIRNLRAFIESSFPKLKNDDLIELGSKLFDLIFRRQVQRLLDRATDKNGQIRPCEIFVEDFEIAEWPWEFLYDRGSGRFLCQELHPISRGIFSLDVHDKLDPMTGDVRMLLITGIKSGDARLKPEQEIDRIREIFNDRTKSKVELEVLRPKDLTQIQQKLTDEKFEIVHFFGHGQMDPDNQEGYLKFEQEQGEPLRCSAGIFARMLANKNLRLVFLNACESARTDPSIGPVRSSVAAALLDRGVPAVIASQYSIASDNAHCLSATIYRHLRRGDPLADAMIAGRQAMSLVNKQIFCDWGVPVLYTSDPDMIIFPPPSDGGTTVLLKPDGDDDRKGMTIIKAGTTKHGTSLVFNTKLQTFEAPPSDLSQEALNDLDVSPYLLEAKVKETVPKLKVMLDYVHPNLPATSAKSLLSKAGAFAFEANKSMMDHIKLQKAGQNLLVTANKIGGEAAPVAKIANDVLKTFSILEHASKPPKIRLNSVAFVDLDAKVSFLPDLVKAVNEAQSFYQFQLNFIPVPSGTIQPGDDNAFTEPQMFLPRIEPHLSQTPDYLGVEYVCCLSRCMIAGDEDGGQFWNYFSAPLDSNPKVIVFSTYELPEYASRAGISFAQAVLFLSLASLVSVDPRWDIDFHSQTKGCMFDYCEDRDDILVGLRHMKFDHASCRKKIKDSEQLKAIDAILALDVKALG